MATKLELVPAAPGKRLGAAVLDWLPPFAVLVIAFTLGFAGVTRSQSGGFIVYDTSSVVLFGSIGVAMALLYAFVMMGMEGRSGVTLGNQVMGIRSADSDGFAPGAGAVFIRAMVTGAGVVLAVLAAVLVVIFRWFDAASAILAPAALVAVAWAVLVVVSNRWDRNNKLQGWQDTVAKTLVFDVKAGRNPVATGGTQGPYSFAPLDLPPVQQVASPVAGVPSAPRSGTSRAMPDGGWAPPQPGTSGVQTLTDPPTAPAAAVVATPVRAFEPSEAPEPPAAAGPSRTFPPATATEHSAAFHPDDDLDQTRMRGGNAAPAPAAAVRIRLDDGRDFRLDRTVLVGRNPVGQGGEKSAMLLAVTDPDRSISKTHLHLLTDGAGVWVTDRNSTNGSSVSTPDGSTSPLRPGVPVYVSPGSTVHFGDRHFEVGQA